MDTRRLTSCIVPLSSHGLHRRFVLTSLEQPVTERLPGTTPETNTQTSTSQMPLENLIVTVTIPISVAEGHEVRISIIPQPNHLSQVLTDCILFRGDNEHGNEAVSATPVTRPNTPVPLASISQAAHWADTVDISDKSDDGDRYFVVTKGKQIGVFYTTLYVYLYICLSFWSLFNLGAPLNRFAWKTKVESSLHIQLTPLRRTIGSPFRQQIAKSL